jgi:flagellar export protein FliJ
MSKFRFNLETLLRHRTLVERQKQVELARVAGEIAQLKSQLADATAAARETAAQISRNPSGVREHQPFIIAMTTRAAALRRRLAACEAQHVLAHAAFADAAKERKAIEMLREKQFAEWRKKQETQEQSEIDDAAARGAGEYHPT